MGVVFQDFRLLDHLSAFDNVALPLRVAGRSSEDYKHDVEELLGWVGLGEKLHARPPTLSGGEQQRVAIARAVIARPDLLLADEPTGNVDPDIAQRLVRLFAELNRLGTTVLIATHDRSLIERTQAREIRLVDGRLIELRTHRA
jgi:cell division transport system ATP-binding protein